ncbi:MAG: hypothetical protein EP330_02905 [Deltaproteobacteria bacterium]|nr:MAG: hypothetical protein EP330_02905 [Deltaproteobacteria bacterium]
MIRITTLALTLAGLVACTGLPDADSGDTWGDTAVADFQGPWQIAEVQWQCEPGSNTWTYYARTDGWATSMSLDIVETGDGNWSENPSMVWDEYHDFDDNLAYAEDGSWDEWQIVLRGVSSMGSQVSGETTLFTCGYHSNDSLSWKATMYGDNSALDCAVWGHRPIEAYGSGCYVFDF